jgi:hypothetical protein
MKPEKLASNVEDIILTAVQDFNEGLEKSQVTAYNKLIAEFKNLSIDSLGNIKRTAENVKVLKKINKAINDSLLTPTYKKRVSTYLKSFDLIEKEQLNYFAVVTEAAKATTMMEAVKIQAIESTVSSLTETVLHEYFTKPLKDIIIRNISTGGSYAEFQEEIRTYILGNDEVDGQFLRYTKQITNDSLSIYNRNYNDGVSKELGLVFYKYTGGLKDTSREFCEERNGKYFHIEEIKAWSRGEKCCGLRFPQGNNWPGRRKGTNENNILSFAGGHGCNHQMIAVSESVVPKEVIERARDKGYLD